MALIAEGRPIKLDLWSLSCSILILALMVIVLSLTSTDATGEIVVQDLYVIDEDLTVQDNITVALGGSLHVVGSRLTFLSEWPLQHGLIVQAGGELVIKDIDGDPSTTSDRSVLDGDMPFFLIVRPGSRVTIDNSLVSRCGAEPTSPVSGSVGADLGTSDFTITGSGFINSTGGVYLNATSGGHFTNCTFTGLRYGIRGDLVGALSVRGCVFEGLDRGIDVRRDPGSLTEALSVEGCVFRNISVEAIAIFGARVARVEVNVFDDCAKAVVLRGTSNAVTDASVSSNRFSGGFSCLEVDETSGVTISGNDLTTFIIAVKVISVTYTVVGINVSGNAFHDGGTGIDLSTVSCRDILIAKNSFRDVMIGVAPWSQGVLVTENEFHGASIAGILHEGDGLVDVIGNRFTSCSYGLKAERDLITRPGLRLVNNTFEGNRVGALLRDLEPLVLEGNRFEGDETGLTIVGSDVEVKGGIVIRDCRVGAKLMATRGVLSGLTVANCSIGVEADLGATVTFAGCAFLTCGTDATVANMSVVGFLDCTHGDAFVARDQWSEIRLLWTCILYVVRASDGSPAASVPCELVPSNTSTPDRCATDADGRVGPRVFLQARFLLAGTRWHLPYSIGLEHRDRMHYCSVPINDAHEYVLVLDDVPPIVGFKKPSHGEILNASTVMFSLTLVDAHSSVAAVDTFIDGQAVRSFPSPQPNVSFEETIADGEHSVLVRAVDDWGNAAETDMVFSVDTKPPEVRIQWPLEGSIWPNVMIPVSCMVSGAITAKLSEIVFAAPSDGIIQTNVNLTREGENTISLAAWDAAGNMASTNVTVLRDMVPPRISLAPVPPLTNNWTVVLQGWTDAHGLWLGEEAIAIGADGRFSRVARLAEGDNLIVLAATDLAGNACNLTVHCTSDRLLEFAVSSPPNGVSLESENATITGIAEAGLRFRLESSSEWTIVGPSGTFHQDLELPKYGTNIFVFDLEDAAGNRGTYAYSLNRVGQTLQEEESGQWLLIIAIVASALIIVGAILVRRGRGGTR